MIRQSISRRRRIVLGLVSLILLAGLYTFVSYRQHQRNPKDTLIPNWTQIGQGIKRACSPDPVTKEIFLWSDIKATYGRLLAGLVIAVIVALVIGVAMGCFTPVEAFCLPPLSFLAKIPPTAMLVVFFVLVGTELKLYVAMIAFGVAPTLAQAVYQSARNDVPDELIYKASTLGASQDEIVWNVVYKQILPRLLESIRLQVGPAMVVLIAAEYLVGGGVGFGNRLRIEQRVLNFNVIFFYLAILGVTGLLIDYSLAVARRKLCPWFSA